MSSDSLPDQLIAFARYFHEALPIEYRNLPSATRNQTCAFQFPSCIGDRRPLNTQHFGEEALRNRQRVVVTAVAHHE